MQLSGHANSLSESPSIFNPEQPLTGNSYYTAWRRILVQLLFTGTSRTLIRVNYKLQYRLLHD
ncbi:hypothetical protein [Zwartia sp.]|uniref:hypothetical protein n=1 Tax=Zwartia sp. TaxID=2978004 RepID=UPI003917C40B